MDYFWTISNFRDTNPVLFRSVITLGNFYSAMLPGDHDIGFYRAGMSRCYLALTSEAEQRGGVPAKISQDVINQFLVDKLHVPISVLQED